MRKVILRLLPDLVIVVGVMFFVRGLSGVTNDGFNSYDRGDLVIGAGMMAIGLLARRNRAGAM